MRGWRRTSAARPSATAAKLIAGVNGRLELAPKDSLIIAACDRLGLPTDRAFVEARRLPPNMQSDLELAISVYREFKVRAHT